MTTVSTDTPAGAKIALVTGGGTGIGAACCKALSAAGFRVGIHYNQSADAAEGLRRELPNAFTLQADLAQSSEIDRLHDQLKQMGGLEVLVQNAGLTADAPLFTAKLEDFDRVVATNMRGTWYLVKRLSRLMMRQRSGRIIQISSVVGSTGNPTQSVYGMTKAAMDNFTKTMAVELAPFNILINSVAPGFIETRMTEVLSDDVKKAILSRIPLQRMGSPEEVAQLVRFLAVEGGYCTGSVFHVNGGMYGG